MAVKNILSVNFDEETGNYNVIIPTGSNMAETAFAMSVIIKCFVKDKIIDNASIITNLIERYLTDPQFDELEESKE